MEARLTWNEAKRASNLAKHGLDFADAGWVLDSIYRLGEQDGELRVRSYSYVLNVLAVLSVVYTTRDGSARIISFRRANTNE
jgi:uncharacterized DUF497 family protein